MIAWDCKTSPVQYSEAAGKAAPLEGNTAFILIERGASPRWRPPDNDRCVDLGSSCSTRARCEFFTLVLSIAHGQDHERT